MDTDCRPAALTTRTPGTLTIATDSPAYAPWFLANDPSNGQGFESAVAHAIADRLGFGKTSTRWVDVAFNSLLDAGPKTFDIALNQVSINADRARSVDFSTGYYDVRQAVITVRGSVVEDATTVRALAGARVAAQSGSTSSLAATALVERRRPVATFETNDLALQALRDGRVDALVVDLPTAFQMTTQQLDDGVILGQLPQLATAPEQFGVVLAKGSLLTECVSRAVGSLRADGTLDRLAREWLSEHGAPELD